MATKKKLENEPVKQSNKPVNKPEIEVKEFDAAGEVLGRLATQIAIALRGKDKPSFKPNMVVGSKVKVKNASKIVLTGRKASVKKYYHHTGYLGNLKTTSVKDLLVKNPAEIIERAVYGMLPDNKLRKEWMKNLEVTN